MGLLEEIEMTVLNKIKIILWTHTTQNVWQKIE